MLTLVVALVVFIITVALMMLIQSQIEKKTLNQVKTEDLAQIGKDVQLSVADVKADVAGVAAKVDSLFHITNNGNAAVKSQASTEKITGVAPAVLAHLQPAASETAKPAQ